MAIDWASRPFVYVRRQEGAVTVFDVISTGALDVDWFPSHVATCMDNAWASQLVEALCAQYEADGGVPVYRLGLRGSEESAEESKL